MKNIKIYLWIVAAVMVPLLVAGCRKDPEKIVPQRALERWNLLINHSPVKAYEYLSPGYRETHTLDQYVAFIGTARLKWKSVAVASQQCESEVCTVILTVKSTIPAQLMNGTKDVELEGPVTEHWVLSEGQWYFLPDTQADLRKPAEAAQKPASATSALPADQATPTGNRGN